MLFCLFEVADNIYLKFIKKIYFLKRLFLVNSQIASVITGLNIIVIVCSKIIYISFEKVRNIFLQDFSRFRY